MNQSTSPIPQWHLAVAQKDAGALHQLLHSSCVFYSPIVFAPQKGKTLTKMYLEAAFRVFQAAGDFRYVKTIEQHNHAMLEFNATIDNVQIDGIDLISWDDTGRITEFKVILRPYRAIEKVGEKMKAELEQVTSFKKFKIGAGALLDKLGQQLNAAKK